MTRFRTSHLITVCWYGFDTQTPGHSSTTLARPYITAAVLSSNNLLRTRQKEDELLFVLYLITPISGLGGLFCVEIFHFPFSAQSLMFCVHSDTWSDAYNFRQLERSPHSGLICYLTTILIHPQILHPKTFSAPYFLSLSSYIPVVNDSIAQST
jgi:hypothetical protein